jgi:NOL1/NOP2/fmu family ribosome biogenesis protein
VLCEAPQNLSDKFLNFFDRVFVDAPCSGEGMFRKEQTDWQKHKPERCAAIQRKILKNAAKMVKPGGKLVYSTCTFELTENEYIIDEFLTTHTGFRHVTVNYQQLGAEPGFSLDRNHEIGCRIWPHLQKGEGHFACVLEKEQSSSGSEATEPKHKYSSEKIVPVDIDDPKLMHFKRFCEDTLNHSISGLTLRDGFLYKTPNLPSLAGLRVLRSGWFLGTLKKDRFVPSQALAMGLEAGDARNCLSLEAQHPNILRYLRGESFEINASNGWVLVCADGFPLGWAKALDGYLKNGYHKSWIME